MKRLEIGIDASRAFCATPTGTETYSTEVIGALAALDEHDLRLYLRQEPLGHTPQNVEARLLPAPRLWTHTRLAVEVALHPPDVLFVPAHVLPFMCRPPAVVTVHDLGHRTYPRAHTLGQRLYLEVSARRHVQRADMLIVDSVATKTDLQNLYGAPPNKIAVAHLGVDPSMGPAAPHVVKEVCRKHGLEADRPYVLHVGTIQPRKNLSLLIEAFAEAARDSVDGPELLVLAGARGWGDCDPIRHAFQCGIADRVRELGYVARDELSALYSGALAAVVPSLYEGFGLTALEAMACGTPVAASNASSLPEVVGDAGLLFDSRSVVECASALRRLASEPDLRSRLRSAGLERAGQFTWRRCARAVMAALERAACRGDATR